MLDKNVLKRELEALLVDCDQESSPFSKRVVSFINAWLKKIQDDDTQEVLIDKTTLKNYIKKKPLDMTGIPFGPGKGKIVCDS